jgi:hypothetical protein
VVVVAHELGEQREQMPLIQHDDGVKTLLAKGPHYPFRDRVRQRRPVGRSDICDPDAGSASSWRERQQSIKTRSCIKTKPSTGAGA